MLNKSSGVTTNIFKARKSNLVQVAVKKVSTASNSAKFYSSYRGSLMEDDSCGITFKMDNNSSLDIKVLKNKEQSEYIVTGRVRCMGEVIEKSVPNSPATRTLQEGILMDATDHMSLTVWVKYINKIRKKLLVTNDRYGYQEVLW